MIGKAQTGLGQQHFLRHLNGKSGIANVTYVQGTQVQSIIRKEILPPDSPNPTLSIRWSKQTSSSYCHPTTVHQVSFQELPFSPRVHISI